MVSDLKAKSITRNKEWHFIMTNNSMHQKIILDLFILNKAASNHIEKICKEKFAHL